MKTSVIPPIMTDVCCVHLSVHLCVVCHTHVPC